MRITLVEPKPPGKHVFSMVTMPRLGLPLLGTVLKNAGHEVRLLYGSGEEIRVSDLLWADIVGVSTTTSTAAEAYHVARYAKGRGKMVVMGGPHVTFLPDEALDNCDYVIRGEADVSFLQLVECIEANELPYYVPGASFRTDGITINNPLSDWVDVNQSPIPDLSLMAGIDSMTTVPIMTSRGCPFDCSFCSVTAMFGRKFRCRDLELVLEEIAQYSDRQVFFIDDNFTANPGRAKLLLTEMIKRGIQPKWWCAQVRTDAVRDDALLELMQQAGCGCVFVGMESVNPATLEKYNKKQGVSDIENCIKRFHDHRIMVHGMFVLGSEDDNAQTVRDTVDFAIANRIDTVQFLILTPFVGTRTFDELEAEGRILTRDWSLYDGHHVVFQPRLMSPIELQTESVKAFKKFYAASRITENVMLTGIKSAGFRATGYWLTRKWEKESQWYLKHLDDKSAVLPPLVSGFQISKSIETLKLKGLRYLSTEKLMQMDISDKNGALLVELKGYLNGVTIKETFKTFKEKLPRTNKELIINIDQVSFSSEQAIRQFIERLNQMAGQAKKIRLKSPVNLDVQQLLQDIMEKYNFPIPRFDF
ncbi:MAG: radical SAM protein [Ignavibacteriales bacterium]